MAIRTRVKTSIKEGVPESDLHIIEFTSHNDIPWTRENKEFKIDDQFFDIVRVDSNNNLKFFCVNDVEETILFAKLDQYVNKHLNDNTPFRRVRKIVSQIIHHYENNEIETFEFSLFSTTIDAPLNKVIDHYQGLELQILTPPPQV